jgi:hypothetical protein
MFGRAKEKGRERRAALLEQARPALIEGEKPLAMAYGQTIHPWVPMGLTVAGVVLGLQGLIDGTLPRAVGVLGVLLLCAGGALSLTVPRRLVIRTDGSLYVLRLDRNARLKEDPRAARTFWTPVANLPSRDGASFKADDERIYPQMGSKLERSAIDEALKPPSADGT